MQYKVVQNEWMCTSTRSVPRQWMKISGQLHATLPPPSG